MRVDPDHRPEEADQGRQVRDDRCARGVVCELRKQTTLATEYAESAAFNFPRGAIVGSHRAQFEESSGECRFSYQAGSWDRKRRVVTKVEWHPGRSRGQVCAAKAGVRPRHPDWSVGWVFDRQIDLIRGGTRPTAPVHDGNCGANALRAPIVGNWGEPSGESRLTRRRNFGRRTKWPLAPPRHWRRHKESIIPIESGLGWHLVWVDSITPGRVPAFEIRVRKINI